MSLYCETSVVIFVLLMVDSPFFVRRLLKFVMDNAILLYHFCQVISGNGQIAHIYDKISL